MFFILHHAVQSLKNLLVHREKCTVNLPLTRQQWCAVLSGLKDAKKLKELTIEMRYVEEEVRATNSKL